ncbi:hypothetical protein CXG81DRAFT_25451 [Caulochytrium protostelioides]|uniref:Uncharacterized protein n=1 Tax=Caulochytrium protostelioides TaxID=1555241 RepID=A0A4P9X980_9FUNG|nr:hypothetical protein CXG81DRAFT_25451 [Caulochytrium protostelioides]|eukprot:RKP01887.1 hypothetical protein CXG81DRAFT_25451 [Caulochytrium protostelioides]
MGVLGMPNLGMGYTVAWIVMTALGVVMMVTASLLLYVLIRRQAALQRTVAAQVAATGTPTGAKKQYMAPGIPDGMHTSYSHVGQPLFASNRPSMVGHASLSAQSRGLSATRPPTGTSCPLSPSELHRGAQPSSARHPRGQPAGRSSPDGRSRRPHALGADGIERHDDAAFHVDLQMEPLHDADDGGDAPQDAPRAAPLYGLDGLPVTEPIDASKGYLGDLQLPFSRLHGHVLPIDRRSSIYSQDTVPTSEPESTGPGTTGPGSVPLGVALEPLTISTAPLPRHATRGGRHPRGGGGGGSASQSDDWPTVTTRSDTDTAFYPSLDNKLGDGTSSGELSDAVYFPGEATLTRINQWQPQAQSDDWPTVTTRSDTDTAFYPSLDNKLGDGTSSGELSDAVYFPGEATLTRINQWQPQASWGAAAAAAAAAGGSDPRRARPPVAVESGPASTASARRSDASSTPGSLTMVERHVSRVMTRHGSLFSDSSNKDDETKSSGHGTLTRLAPSQRPLSHELTTRHHEAASSFSDHRPAMADVNCEWAPKHTQTDDAHGQGPGGTDRAPSRRDMLASMLPKLEGLALSQDLEASMTFSLTDRDATLVESTAPFSAPAPDHTGILDDVPDASSRLRSHKSMAFPTSRPIAGGAATSDGASDGSTMTRLQRALYRTFASKSQTPDPERAIDMRPSLATVAASASASASASTSASAAGPALAAVPVLEPGAAAPAWPPADGPRQTEPVAAARSAPTSAAGTPGPRAPPGGILLPGSAPPSASGSEGSVGRGSTTHGSMPRRYRVWTPTGARSSGSGGGGGVRRAPTLHDPATTSPSTFASTLDDAFADTLSDRRRATTRGTAARLRPVTLAFGAAGDVSLSLSHAERAGSLPRGIGRPTTGSSGLSLAATLLGPSEFGSFSLGLGSAGGGDGDDDDGGDLGSRDWLARGPRIAGAKGSDDSESCSSSSSSSDSESDGEALAVMAMAAALKRASRPVSAAAAAATAASQGLTPGTYARSDAAGAASPLSDAGTVVGDEANRSIATTASGTSSRSGRRSGLLTKGGPPARSAAAMPAPLDVQDRRGRSDLSTLSASAGML